MYHEGLRHDYDGNDNKSDIYDRTLENHLFFS